MAEIVVKGFTSKLETKTAGSGKTYHKFSLSEGQKQQDGTFKSVWYNVTSFDDGPPADGSKVTIKGYLKMKEGNNGKTYHDVVANEIEVLEGPSSKKTPKAPKKEEKNPWD